MSCRHHSVRAPRARRPIAWRVPHTWRNRYPHGVLGVGCARQPAVQVCWRPGSVCACTCMCVRARTSHFCDALERASVNGERILIRGGGWSPDLFLRDDPVRLTQQVWATPVQHPACSVTLWVVRACLSAGHDAGHGTEFYPSRRQNGALECWCRGSVCITSRTKFLGSGQLF
jgi:hypothetical protein